MCNIDGRIGPFHFNGKYPPLERKVGSKTFLIGIATAYNAMGLIGTEHNGVFILDDTEKQVVLDRHAEGPSGGFGPSPSQEKARAELMEMADHDFLNFIIKHPR